MICARIQAHTGLRAMRDGRLMPVPPGVYDVGYEVRGIDDPRAEEYELSAGGEVKFTLSARDAETERQSGRIAILEGSL